ncbi:MAG: O-antigen ligase family protein [Candidatus Gracilibacteria bacterium]|jgi:hypothetical protein
MAIQDIQKKLFFIFVILTPLLFNPFSGNTEGVKLIIFAFISLIFFLLNKNTAKIIPVLKYSIACLIILGALSTILSQDIYSAFWGSQDRRFGFYIFLSGLFLALGMPKLKTKEILNGCIIAGTIVSIVAILLGIFIESSLFEGRISGTMGNPNLLGQFLLITLFFSIYRFLENRKNIDIFSIIIQASALILSGNRASILALIITTFLYIIISKKSWKILIYTMIFFGIICAFSIERILSFQSIQTRLEIYIAAFKAILKDPFFGVGFENLHYFLKMPETYTLLVDRVHQFFLDYALAAGIPFVMAFTTLSVSSIVILLKKQKVFGFAFLGLLISLQFNFMGIVDMMMFAIFIGLAIQSKTIARQSKNFSKRCDF